MNRPDIGLVKEVFNESNGKVFYDAFLKRVPKQFISPLLAIAALRSAVCFGILSKERRIIIIY